MVAKKYSASMDEELLEEVREAAEEQDETLSAFLAAAAKHRVQLLVAERELDEWEAENGAFTEEEMAEAEAWLDDVVAQQEAVRRDPTTQPRSRKPADQRSVRRKATGHGKRQPQASKGRGRRSA